MKRDYHPAVRKYAGCSGYSTCAVHYSLYRDIFSLPAVAGHRSFVPAKWSERALRQIPAARRERQGKISFNLLRFLPSSGPDLYGN